jgi:hypothetical protein
MKPTPQRALLVMIMMVFLLLVGEVINDLFLRARTQPDERHFPGACINFVDLQESEYGGRYSLPAHSTSGLQTFRSGNAYHYKCEFVKPTRFGDVYLLKLMVPEGSNIVKAVVFDGTAQVLLKSESEVIEIN